MLFCYSFVSSTNFSLFFSVGKNPAFEKGTVLGGKHPNYKADKVQNKVALKPIQNSGDCSGKVAGTSHCVNSVEFPP